VVFWIDKDILAKNAQETRPEMAKYYFEVLAITFQYLNPYFNYSLPRQLGEYTNYFNPQVAVRLV
jgi:hypothetical protein